ncbi:kinocilin [Odontesthes bonariensis]
MNPVSVGEYHGLRVGSALLSIVAGCIIIGVSRECDADAVGGIFLGAGGLGLLISIYPFIKGINNQDRTSSDMPDVLSRRKLKQSPTDQDLP